MAYARESPSQNSLKVQETLHFRYLKCLLYQVPWCTNVQSFDGTLSFWGHKIVDTCWYCTVPPLLMMLKISPRKCFPGHGATWMHVVLVQIKNMSKIVKIKIHLPFHPPRNSTCDIVALATSHILKWTSRIPAFGKMRLAFSAKRLPPHWWPLCKHLAKKNNSQGCGVNNHHFKSFHTLMRMCESMLVIRTISASLVGFVRLTPQIQFFNTQTRVYGLSMSLHVFTTPCWQHPML